MLRVLRLGRRLRLLMLMLFAVSILVACGGGGSPAGSTSALPPSQLASPAVFAAAVSEPDRVTVNVHVPDEGSISGTDLTIPFDEIDARRSELPPTTTPLAVYCRSGRMSAEAVQTLARLGYQDIVELNGGMFAWEADGRGLLPPAAE